MWVDTHAHLMDEQYDQDREAVFSQAQTSGVKLLIEIGESQNAWPLAKRWAHVHAGCVWWTAGWHPTYAHQAREGFEKDLTQAAQDELCVAIGEIGLDYHRSPVDRAQQERVVRASLEVAQELGKPVVIHCRDAFEDLLRILSEIFPKSSSSQPTLQQRAPVGVTPPPALGPQGSELQHPPPADRQVAGVIHCFSGDLKSAQSCIELGFLLGIDGPLTYPNAKRLRAVIEIIPLEYIVLETDSPYLPPQPYRGKRNEPGYLPFVGEALASLKKTSLEEVARITTENAARLFRLSFDPCVSK